LLSGKIPRIDAAEVREASMIILPIPELQGVFLQLSITAAHGRISVTID
jgi:hypothetical protein